MIIDHFDGKSLKRRPLDWLNEAFRDAMVKYHSCAEPDAHGRTSPAHAAMWNGIASKYQAEVDRRRIPSERNTVKPVEHGTA
jgi:hypothetical protein